MDKKIVSIDFETLEKIIYELREIEILTPEGPVKFRVNNLIESIIKVTGVNSTNSLEERILKKMKESKVNNPELHTKLYILYRNLSEAKISLESAEGMYENYLEMYPFDTMIF
jgi:hypothetical protein